MKNWLRRKRRKAELLLDRSSIALEPPFISIFHFALDFIQEDEHQKIESKMKS